MSALIRKLFWFAVFLLATFCFIVLFEHGPSNFQENARKVSAELKEMFGTTLKRQPDKSDDPSR
jgi:hypothetical protein